MFNALASILQNIIFLLKKLENKNWNHPLPYIIQYEKILEISVFSSGQDGRPKVKWKKLLKSTLLEISPAVKRNRLLY